MGHVLRILRFFCRLNKSTIAPYKSSLPELLLTGQTSEFVFFQKSRKKKFSCFSSLESSHVVVLMTVVKTVRLVNESVQFGESSSRSDVVGQALIRPVTRSVGQLNV